MYDIRIISNIKGVDGNIWSECQAYILTLEITSKTKLNRNQWINLCKIIEYVIKINNYLMACSNAGLKFGFLLNELFFISNKYYFKVKNIFKKIIIVIFIFLKYKLKKML